MSVAVSKKPHIVAPLIVFPLMIVLLVFAGIFCLVIASIPISAAAAVGIGYGLIYDGKTETIEYEEDFKFETMGNRILVDSLDTTVEQQRVSIKLTQSDVNNLIHMGLSQVNLPVVKKAYVVVDGETYHFYVDLDAYVIKTRAHLTTTLREDRATNSFVFKIKDISFGNIRGLRGSAKRLLDMFITEDKIQSFIESTKLSVKYDPARLSISYNKEDMVKDILNMMGNGSGESSGLGDTGIYLKIINSILDHGLIRMDLKSDSLLEGMVDLSKLRTNEYVTEDPNQIVVESEDINVHCKQALESLVVNKKVDPSKDNLENIFRFLFSGYANVDDSIRNSVKGIDMSSIGINDYTTYTGLIPEADDILSKMSEHVNVHGLVNGDTHVCELFENEITSYVRTRSVVGYTALLKRETKDGYKINYVTVDNFYCNIYKDRNNEYAPTIDFIIRININGFPTSLAFSALLPNGEIKNNTLTFTLHDMKFGSITDENLINTFFGIIADALKGGDNSIAADSTKHSISFNFTNIIKDAQAQVEDYVHALPGRESWSGDDFFRGENIILTTHGEDGHDDGFLKITLRQPIDF